MNNIFLVSQILQMYFTSLQLSDITAKYEKQRKCWLLYCARYTLGKKCHNKEFFLVRIFTYSVLIRENTDQKKLYLDIFRAVIYAMTSL